MAKKLMGRWTQAGQRTLRYSPIAVMVGLSFILLGCSGPQGGAGAGTGLSTDYSSLEQIYVAPGGSDLAAGTKDAPLATISEGVRRAMKNRSSGLGTRVIVMPGTYREAIQAGGSTSGPLIVVESYSPHAAVVTGADRWTGWACGGGVCSHAWPYRWGAAPDPWSDVPVGELARRRELISVDGVNLDQVLSRTALTAGSFFVDEGAGVVYVMPPSGVDLNAVDVEVGVRPTLLRLQGMGDVVVKGLVFTHAASVFREAAINVIEDSNVLVDDCVVVWNGQNGLALTGRGLTVQGSTFDHNGSSGLQGYKLADVKVVDGESSFNNWRGVRVGYTHWEVGQKFAGAHDITFTNFRAVGNQSRGLWFDTDNASVTIEGSRICNNLLDGLFVESNQGPITVRDTVLCSNQGAGLLTSQTGKLTISGDTFQNNSVAELKLSGDFGGTVTDWETGKIYNLANVTWSVHGNTVTNALGALLVATTYSSSEWSTLMSTSTFDGNDYSASAAQPFQVGGGSTVTFSSWRSSTHQDAASTYKSIPGT